MLAARARVEKPYATPIQQGQRQVRRVDECRKSRKSGRSIKELGNNSVVRESVDDKDGGSPKGTGFDGCEAGPLLVSR
jgi:hypothetical protein